MQSALNLFANKRNRHYVAGGVCVSLVAVCSFLAMSSAESGESEADRADDVNATAVNYLAADGEDDFAPARIVAFQQATGMQGPRVTATGPRFVTVGYTAPAGEAVDGTNPSSVQLCQALGPAAPCPITGVDSACGDCCGELQWCARSPIPWQIFAQGEYVGPHRLPHIAEYRVRVDDQINFVYRLSREESSAPYELNVGDVIEVESLTDEKLDRELVIQPDGTITLRLLGQIRAARLTVPELKEKLTKLYQKFYKERVFSITVTPLQVNTKLEDLRATVDSRAGIGGQGISVRVTPAGTIQLPALGSFPVQGLTLNELKREVDQRYMKSIEGIEVTPVLEARAPRYVYVLGEVVRPDRYELTGPTTAMQALALAGGTNNGANLREVVVLRRAEDWRLMATKLDLRGAILGKRPIPSDEIWIRDSDLIIVPKSPLLIANEIIELLFTNGVYGVLPFQGISINMSKLSTI